MFLLVALFMSARFCDSVRSGPVLSMARAIPCHRIEEAQTRRGERSALRACAGMQVR
jgi:hypothetical protein